MEKTFVFVTFEPGDPNNPLNSPITVKMEEFDELLQWESELLAPHHYGGKYLFPMYLTYGGIKYTLWGEREDGNEFLAVPANEELRFGIELRKKIMKTFQA